MTTLHRRAFTKKLSSDLVSTDLHSILEAGEKKGVPLRLTAAGEAFNSEQAKGLACEDRCAKVKVL